MTAAHILRHPTGKPRKTAAAPAVQYAPGWFTELMRAHNWPPRFRSQIDRIVPINVNGETAREVATRSRERGLAEGKWHATGTIPIGKSPRDSRPVGYLVATNAGEGV